MQCMMQIIYLHSADGSYVVELIDILQFLPRFKFRSFFSVNSSAISVPTAGVFHEIWGFLGPSWGSGVFVWETGFFLIFFWYSVFFFYTQNSFQIPKLGRKLHQLPPPSNSRNLIDYPPPSKSGRKLHQLPPSNSRNLIDYPPSKSGRKTFLTDFASQNLTSMNNYRPN